MAGYIYIKFSNEQTFKSSYDFAVGVIKQSNPHLAGQMVPEFYAQLWHVFMTTLVSIIIIYLLLHSIVYLLHHYGKSFAYGYIKLYAWSGGVLMTLFAIIGIQSLEGAMFLIPGIALLFVALGVKHFPDSKSTEE
ncbi:MAG: hypothetical protein BM556_05255 [Bacteriovorax sp. MedPE-SWde]|nr:MAG: hypothetical protein BM556_05255 [Bacteriovorax sp. MedPE-SWde]